MTLLDYWQAEGGRRGRGETRRARITRPFHDRAPYFFQAPLIFRLNYLRCYGIISDRPLRLPLWTLSIHQISKYTRWVRGHPFSELAHALSNSFETEGAAKKRLGNSERESDNNKESEILFFFFFVFVYLFFSFSLFYSNFGKFGCWRVAF